MAFLRNLLANLVALTLFFVVGFFLIIGAISALVSAEDEAPNVKANTILRLDLNGVVIQERVPEDDPLTELSALSGGPSTIGLIDLKAVINEAANDDRIAGIMLETSAVGAGAATMQEVRQALEQFKESGKFIVSYNSIMAEWDYYLASAANEIYMYPDGGMELNGMAMELAFIKGTLDKLGVEAQIFRVGDFKAAVEPLMRTNMSPENRQQNEELLSSIYGHYIETVAAARNIDPAKLRTLSDEMKIETPQDAVDNGLVDGLKYYDEVMAMLNQRTDRPKDAELRTVSYKNYKKTLPANSTYGKDKVAVIVASGTIQAGSESTNITEKLAKDIRKARKDDRIKAIVLRINSPGGSKLISDILWREIDLARQAKPVISSMSDVAASGGYYLAMQTDTIVAHPTTITGSIGIFGVWFNAQKLLEEKIGVTTDVVATGKYSNLMSMSKPMGQDEIDFFQRNVERGYADFIAKVANGRGMTEEAVRKVASGRVWSGQQGLERGLVDVLGGLETAIDIAANKAGLSQDDYAVAYYPELKSPLEELIETLSGETEVRIMQDNLGPLTPYVQQIKDLQELKGVQMRMPYQVRIY